MIKETQTKIENTIMHERYNDDGVLVNYIIEAKAGYKIHDISYDEKVIDENFNETGEIKIGYSTGIITVLANYDFKENPREIYAVKI